MRSRRIGRCIMLAIVPFVIMAVGCAAKPQYVGRVEIVGDVEMPGFYSFYEKQNAKVVAEQAGEIDEENTKYVLLFHAGEKAPYQSMALKNFRDYAHEILLKPDDVIVFSRIAKSEFYLNANVETGGAHPWVPNLTVGDAINTADVEGQHFLKTGIRISRYGEKDVGRAGQRADKILPGDTILLYDLYQATKPEKKWVERTPRTKPIMVDEEGKLKGVETINR
ncbi:MAG: hypothetical protein AB1696_19505 [Planctomycetota bacterium]